MPEPKKLLKLVEIAPNCMKLDCLKLPKIAKNYSKLPQIARTLQQL